MTVWEIYDRQIRDLPVTEQLRLASLILDELARGETVTEQAFKDLVRLHSPANDILINATATHRPPQDWWDADLDPTEPAEHNPAFLESIARARDKLSTVRL